MKICFIAHSRLPSTTANSIHVVKNVQSFAQLGHDVQLLASEPVGEGVQADSIERPAAQLARFYDLKPAAGSDLPFPVEWLPASRRFHRYDYAWQAVQHARKMGADLVYTWMPQVGLATLLNGMPLIMEVHEPPTGRFGTRLFGLILRLPGRKRFVPLSQVMADIIQKRYPLFSQRNKSFSIVVCHDAVDLQPYTALPGPSAARARLGLPERLTVGHTGHLYAGRGIGLLISLARRFPQVTFLLVGGRQAELEAWRARVKQAGAHNIIMTGFVERQLLPLYQAASDVLLMPYERVVAGSSGGDNAEFCSPMKMFEYMACGRAIISSDLPAIREVLNAGNSVLCPPEDESAWAAALEAMVGSAELRQKLGQQAFLDVQNHTWLARSERVITGFLEA